jgi:5-hydroxyisourate hydrolase
MKRRPWPIDCLLFGKMRVTDTSETHPGEYEIVFQVGAYFGLRPENAFLNEVPVRFNISDPTDGYHVPLVVTRWAYNTYRGR